jgi:four helix bundle protein
MLDYEKLDVYQCAIEHLACVFKWLPLLPRGHSALTDQWRRAAMSIPLNIGEGAARPASPSERIAMRSLAERRWSAVRFSTS